MRVPLLCALPFLVAGCLAGGPGGSPRFAPLGERSTHEDLSDAQRMYDDGQYHAAVSRLQRVLAREPSRGTEAEAHYLLGVTYRRIDVYKDAIEELDHYLRLEPSGRHAEEATDLLAVLRAAYEERYPPPERIREQENALRAQLANEPGNATLQRELAELLWRQAKYDESAALLVAIAERDPAFKSDPTFTRRVDLSAGGRYVVLSPDEQMRREIELHPLNVINTSTFRADPDRRTRVPRAFVVSGEVINRSDEAVYDTEVYVTIYAFGRQVYDTGTRRIGLLRAGETRAFSARFNNFDNIDNIDRYECVATYRGAER